MPILSNVFGPLLFYILVIVVCECLLFVANPISNSIYNYSKTSFSFLVEDNNN